ncbi:MAG: hypothetical protein AAGD05_03345 [Bacteroidota bacterium]
MKKLMILLLVNVLLFACQTEPVKDKAPSDIDLIKACYQKYKDGILQKNGAEVLAQVSTKTLDFYGQLLRYAKGADSTAIAESGLTEKFTILMTRQRMDTQELVNMSNKRYFTYIIENGMIGKSSVEGVELGALFVEGNTAKGDMVIDGKAQKYKYQFVKEEEGWKIDLINLMTIASDGLKAEILQSPFDEYEHLYKLLQIMTRQPLKEDIWEPRI